MPPNTTSKLLCSFEGISFGFRPAKYATSIKRPDTIQAVSIVEVRVNLPNSPKMGGARCTAIPSPPPSYSAAIADSGDVLNSASTKTIPKIA